MEEQDPRRHPYVRVGLTVGSVGFVFPLTALICALLATFPTAWLWVELDRASAGFVGGAVVAQAFVISALAVGLGQKRGKLWWFTLVVVATLGRFAALRLELELLVAAAALFVTEVAYGYALFAAYEFTRNTHRWLSEASQNPLWAGAISTAGLFLGGPMVGLIALALPAAAVSEERADLGAGPVGMLLSDGLEALGDGGDEISGTLALGSGEAGSPVVRSASDCLEILYRTGQTGLGRPDAVKYLKAALGISKGDAEDLASEKLLEICTKRFQDSARTENDLRAYYWRSVENLAKDVGKGKGRHRYRTCALPDSASRTTGGLADLAWINSGPSIDDELDDAACQQRLKKAMCALSESDRNLALSCVDKPLSEVAEIIGRSKTTAKRWCDELLERLRVAAACAPAH